VLVRLAETFNRCPVRLLLESQAGFDFDDRVAADFFEFRTMVQFNRNVFNSLNVGIFLGSSSSEQARIPSAR